MKKNANRITAADLISLLHYNNISLWEFFSRLNHDDKMHEYQIEELSNIMISAYYAGDKVKLKGVKRLIDESHLSKKDREQQKLIVDGWLESMKDEKESHDEELRQKLKEQVFNSPNFNKSNITLYCNFMGFYDLESNKAISRQILKQYESNTDVNVQITLLAIIVNMLILIIENKKVNEAKFYVESAAKISTRPELFFYKSGIYFFTNAIDYQLFKDKKYLDQCNQFIDVFIKLGMESYGNRLKLFLKRYILDK